tara:strand:- start:502 stop:735 length:234 start_codon:yes stop_codon:yes gene_type:complete
MSTEHKIKNILLDLIKENDLKIIDIGLINEHSILTSDLGLDSFNLAQLTVIIESEFGIDIFEKKVVRTVGEILDQLK